jgi:hypothetical protein
MSNENSQKSWWKGCGCFFILFMVLGVGMLVAAFAVMMAIGEEVASGSFSIAKHASTKAGEDEVPFMKETWSYGAGEEKVIRIPLKGFGLYHGASDDPDWLNRRDYAVV